MKELNLSFLPLILLGIVLLIHVTGTLFSNSGLMGVSHSEAYSKITTIIIMTMILALGMYLRKIYWVPERQ